jgi:ABC-type multidrug transport system ATPase subunit/DNA-binding beta-propeller fold protein YncE
MTATLWQLQGVSLGADWSRRLREVSVDISTGVTALLGASGAGKTSLLNVLVGFERPTSGTVCGPLGLVPEKTPSGDERLPLFWVPPDFGLWPHLNVRDHVTTVMPRRRALPAGDVTGASAIPQVGPEQVLGMFHLAAAADGPVQRLSQGEQSRLAVARALASEARVLVMDEPLVHVDPVHLPDFWERIREWCTDRGMSLVFSTHDPEIAVREAERVICLERGTVVYGGTVESLYHDPPTARLARYLGPANWFEPEERPLWLPCEATARGRCVRPERLEVLRTDDGPLVVRDSRPGGPVTFTEVERLTLTDAQAEEGVLSRAERPNDDSGNAADIAMTGGRRRLVHRTGPSPLPVGGRVALRVCAALWTCLMITGCGGAGDEPLLRVRSVRTLKMPPDGPRIPAPRAMTVSPDGELFVLDNAGRVLVYDTATDSGHGASSSEDDSAAQGNSEAERPRASDELVRHWRMPASEVGNPEGICLLGPERVAVADTHYHRVVIFSRDGDVLLMFGEYGQGPGQFIYPVAITHDNAGHLYVAEYGGNDRVQKFREDGTFVAAFGSFGTEEGQFQRPGGIVWFPEDVRREDAPERDRQSGRGGTLIVADAVNHRLLEFSDAGEYLGVLAGGGDPLRGEGDGRGSDAGHESSAAAVGRTSSGVVEPGARRSAEVLTFEYPYNLAAAPDGTLFVVEYGGGRVTQVSRRGELLGRFGRAGRGTGEFFTPWGLTVDRRGHVFVADTGNHRIVELTL